MNSHDRDENSSTVVLGRLSLFPVGEWPGLKMFNLLSM